MLRVLFDCCCGLDVHVKTIVACLLIGDRKIIRTFSTMTDDLLELADWLKQAGCTHVAMESTGVYWKPAFNILEGLFTIIVANPSHIKAVPGRKTDVKDCEWIATLLRHGLLQASFIPPREIRDVRELTRYRMTLAEERARLANRIQKLIESANIKLGQVASDALGVSGLAMLRALADGHTDPRFIAGMAKGQLKHKQADLVRALHGKLSTAQRWLLSELLTSYEQIEAATRRVHLRIDEELQQIDPQIGAAINLIDAVPGIGRALAQDIIAEIGVTMDSFHDARHLASWAGMCPGNHESAGKRSSGATTKGNVYLKRALCQAAWAAAHSKGTYFHAQYMHLVARLGKKRTIVAIGHALLTSIFHMLKNNDPYRDLGPDHFLNRDKQRQTDKYVSKLRTLGYEVTIREKSKAA